MADIRYRVQCSGVEPDHLRGFFVGWPNPPSPVTHLRILQNSDAIVLATDAATQQAVGFITAITDHVSSAYIPHLEVLPAYQGQGIGSELVRRMCSQLEGLYMIDLVCDDDVRPFYERLGFRALTGMAIRSYANQSGRSHLVPPPEPSAG